MKDTNRGTQGVSRRDALKTLGAGAALLSLGMISNRALADEASVPATAPAVTGGATQPFTLPKLDYAFDALEPHIDARTMEIHYTKHHQTYITNANKALADHPDLQKLTAEEILKHLDTVPEGIRTALRNNVGGHANHSFFWKVITPHGTDAMSSNSRLSLAISQAFPSFGDFKQKFGDAAAKRFGSGWAWLSAKPDGSLVIHSTANQDSPLSEGLTPVLGLDVWEHAYYLHYQNRRADYVAAFWNVVNWAQASANYAAALG